VGADAGGSFELPRRGRGERAPGSPGAPPFASGKRGWRGDAVSGEQRARDGVREGGDADADELGRGEGEGDGAGRAGSGVGARSVLATRPSGGAPSRPGTPWPAVTAGGAGADERSPAAARRLQAPSRSPGDGVDGAGGGVPRSDPVDGAGADAVAQPPLRAQPGGGGPGRTGAHHDGAERSRGGTSPRQAQDLGVAPTRPPGEARAGAAGGHEARAARSGDPTRSGSMKRRVVA